MIASAVGTLRRLIADRDLLAELRLALKMTSAGTLSWWLATQAGEPRPIFAALVPFVAMSGDPFSAVSISVGRILGVFAGVAIGIALLATPLGALAQVGLGLLAGSLVGIGLRVGGRPNVQAAVSALFLIALGRSGAAHAGVTRIWETAIGAGVTICVAARAVAEAADLELRDGESPAALAAAAARLESPDPSLDGEAVVVRAQLRQMLADLQAAANISS